MRRTLRIARAEMAATLGFISLAAHDTHAHTKYAIFTLFFLSFFWLHVKSKQNRVLVGEKHPPTKVGSTYPQW